MQKAGYAQNFFSSSFNTKEWNFSDQPTTCKVDILNLIDCSKTTFDFYCILFEPLKKSFGFVGTLNLIYTICVLR